MAQGTLQKQVAAEESGTVRHGLVRSAMHRSAAHTIVCALDSSETLLQQHQATEPLERQLGSPSRVTQHFAGVHDK